MKVYVTQPLCEPSTTELLAGFEVIIGVGRLSARELAERLSGVAALVATPADPVTDEVLAAASTPLTESLRDSNAAAFGGGAPPPAPPGGRRGRSSLATAAFGLRVVANVAVGTDNIDLSACQRRGIVVTNTPDVLTEATADLAWLLVLAVTRRLPEGEALARSGAWDGWKPLELLGVSLQGKTLGIYGLGRIGSAVARRAEAFGMEVLGVRGGDGEGRFFEMLERSDVITIHAPLTPLTRGRFGEAELARMKPGAFLVNVARGPLVDEGALVRALERGHLRGAGLDVFEHEPTIHPGLRARRDVVLLPHLGSATFETRLAMARVACAEAARVLRGEAPRHRVV